MDNRMQVKILGYAIGTALNGHPDGELVEVFLEFEPYDGFDMPSSGLFVDYGNGEFISYDDDGNEIVTKGFLTVMNGFIARQHHNNKKAQNANATDA